MSVYTCVHEYVFMHASTLLPQFHQVVPVVMSPTKQTLPHLLTNSSATVTNYRNDTDSPAPSRQLDLCHRVECFTFCLPVLFALISVLNFVSLYSK